MSIFKFDVERPSGWERGSAQRIALRVYDRTLTRLARNGIAGEDDYLLANPEALAFWLIDNWWRLRWESLPTGDDPRSDWRLAHELTSVGGAVWPRTTFWSEGSRIGVMAKADPVETIAPVRYLESALMFVSADQWESGVDAFLYQVAQDQTATTDFNSLSAHVARLQEERTDQEVSDWRRVEAKLGFDPDEAPDDLMTSVRGFYRFYKGADVEEALAATPGSNAPRALQRELDAVASSKITIEPAEAIKVAGDVKLPVGVSPWEIAENVAGKVRRAAGWGLEPLRNKRLAELLGVHTSAFTATTTPVGSHPYGLRLATGDGAASQKVNLWSRASRDRRFELARSLADMIWSRCSRMGVATSAKTDRQRFQRAFAQSLLCPFDGLMSYLGTEHPTDEDMNAAAEHFHVNIRMIKTTLVNKKIISPSSLYERLEAA